MCFIFVAPVPQGKFVTDFRNGSSDLFLRLCPIGLFGLAEVLSLSMYRARAVHKYPVPCAPPGPGEAVAIGKPKLPLTRPRKHLGRPDCVYHMELESLLCTGLSRSFRFFHGLHPLFLPLQRLQNPLPLPRLQNLSLTACFYGSFI